MKSLQLNFKFKNQLQYNKFNMELDSTIANGLIIDRPEKFEEGVEVYYALMYENINMENLLKEIIFEVDENMEYTIVNEYNNDVELDDIETIYMEILNEIDKMNQSIDEIKNLLTNVDIKSSINVIKDINSKLD